MDTINGQNTVTGDGSSNINNSSISDTQSNTQTNVGNATNIIDFVLSTGSNTVSDNTSAGPVTIGDASLVALASTEVNGGAPNGVTTTVIASPGADPVIISSINQSTGANSTNTNTQAINNTATTNVSNISSINNVAEVVVSTGGNTFSNNTTVGPITTGSIHVTVRFASAANSGGGATLPAGGGSGGGGGPVPGGNSSGNPVPIVSIASPEVPSFGFKGSGLGQLISSNPGSSGTGFFPAGASFLPQFLIALVIAVVLVNGKSFRLTSFYNRIFSRIEKGFEKFWIMLRYKLEVAL